MAMEDFIYYQQPKYWKEAQKCLHENRMQNSVF